MVEIKRFLDVETTIFKQDIMAKGFILRKSYLSQLNG